MAGEGVVIKYNISEENLKSPIEVTRIKGHTEAVTSVLQYEENIITSSVDGFIKVRLFLSI